MPSERWGTFAVRDHIERAALIPEIILYDRLILPKYVTPTDRDSWADRNWDPDALDAMLETLGNLVTVRNWSEDRTASVEQRMEAHRVLQENAPEIRRTNARFAPQYQITRDILAEEERRRLKMLGEEDDILVVAAYQSIEQFGASYETSTASRKDTIGSHLGLLLSHEFLVPLTTRDADETFAAVVTLARSSKFIESRRDFYRWQERTVREIGTGMTTPEDAVIEMRDLLATYNSRVSEAVKKTRKRFAYTLAAVALAAAPVALKALVVAPLLTTLGLGAAALRLAQFVALERSPQVDAGDLRPAVMFHAARKELRRK